MTEAPATEAPTTAPIATSPSPSPTATATATAPVTRLQVDPIRCHAHGVCAELLPEIITLDEWGYPIIDDDGLPPALKKTARRAVRSCPALALSVRQDR